MSPPVRIAVTGVGIVSGVGIGAAEVFARLCRGDRGVGDVTLFDVSGQRCGIAVEVRDDRVGALAAERGWTRADAMAVLAARDACAASGVGAGTGLGVVVGATTGGMLEAERRLRAAPAPRDPSWARGLLDEPLGATAHRVARDLGARGPVSTLCSACSSGATAIVLGAAWLSTRRVSAVLAGGVDGLSALTFAGFDALGALDPEPCRPFDRSRAGLTLGEGAAFLVLETDEAARARGAAVLAILSGWAVGAEAHHVTQPEPSGATARRLLREALGAAGRRPTDVGYVNAHGTGTQRNDEVEAAALDDVFGDASVIVSSSKAQLGHSLGASGALEAVVTVLAVAAQRAPPTAGLSAPLPSRVRLSGTKLPIERPVALSSSFGFGGTGVVLAFERVGPEGGGASHVPGVQVLVTGASSDRSGVGAPSLDARRTRRFDALSTRVTAGVEALAATAAIEPAGSGLVVGTAFGNVTRTADFLTRLVDSGPRFVPPADFPHLLASSAPSNASIYLGLRGPVLAATEGAASAHAALHCAASLIQARVASTIIAGAATVPDAIADELLEQHLDVATGWLCIEDAHAARRRGASVLAHVAAVVQLDDGAADDRRLTLPTDPTLALVVTVDADDDLAPLLRRIGWTGVEVESLPRLAREAGGAAALVHGVKRIGTGRRQVLVCGRAEARWMLTLLEAHVS